MRFLVSIATTAARAEAAEHSAERAGPDDLR